MTALAATDSIETGLWFIFALLLASAYCIALLTP